MEEKLSELLQTIIRETNSKKMEEELKALLFSKVSGSLGTLNDLDN